MRKITFISALVGAVFVFLALGSTKAQAWGNCEDRIFHSGSTVGYYCDERDQDGDTDDFCTWFSQGGALSFQWYLDNGDVVVDCQCRKTRADFGTHPYEFLCTGLEEDDFEATGITGKIFWKGGPIQAEGVDVDLDDDDDSGGFVLKCRPDPDCVPPS